MKISNRILITVGAIYIVASILIVALVNYEMRQQALLEAESKALMLINRNLATHDYFSRELKPKLFSWSAPFRSPEYFEPTWMSSTYAVRRMDHYFKSLEKFKYYYKECAVNARSPENEADPEERAFLEQLNTDPKLIKRSEVRTLNGQPFFVIMRRGEQMEESCLQCHSTPDRAPGNLVKTYGPTRSFDRRVGEAVQAISIRIPLAEAYGQANRLSWHLSGILLGLIGCLFASQTWINKRWLFDPMAAIRHKALEIVESEARLGETIPVPAGRELQELTTAFNTMSANLRQSHDSLEERVGQRTADLNRLNERLEQDIRKRQQVEESLREATEAFQALIQASPLAIFVLDPEGRVQLWNDAAQRIFGWTAAEAVGQVLPIVPEDKMSEFRGLLQKALDGKPLLGVEVRRRKKDGTPIDIQAYSATLYDPQGRVTGVLALVADNTLEKQAEEALKKSEWEKLLILESVEELLVFMDKDLRIIWANLASGASAGESPESLAGRFCYEIWQQRSQPCMNCPVQEVIKTGHPQAGEQSSPDGRWWSILAYPAWDEHGDLSGVVEITRDITARKQAEEELNAIRERLELALLGADLGTWDWNVPTGAVEFNDRWTEMLGYRREEVEPHLRSWEKLVHPDDLPAVTEVLNAHLEGKTPFYETEHRLRHKSGEWVWVLDKGKVIERDAQGRPRRACGTHLDITRRKRLEESLKIEQQELKLILDSASTIIFYKDREGRFLRVNKAFAERHNMPEAEFIGKTVFDLYPARIAQGMTDDDHEVLQAGLPKLNIIEEYVSASGMRWVQTDKIPIHGENGEVIGLVGFAQDITERKAAAEALSQNYRKLQETAQQLEQSRNMLQLIIESAPVRVFWKDGDLRYLGCNTLFARDAGLSHPQQLLGKDDFVMGWKEQADLYRSDDRQVMESRRPKINIIEPQTTPTGDKIWLSTSKVPLQTPNGEVFGVLGVYEDITERKRTEEVLRETRNYLENLLEYANAPIIVWDPSFRITRFNRAFENLTGYSAQEVVGQKLDLLFPEASCEESLSKIARTSGGEYWDSVEIPILRKDGDIRITLWNSANIHAEDGATLVATIAQGQDITERKRAEEAFRVLVNNAPIGIYIVQDGNFKMINLGFEKITGYTSGELFGSESVRLVSPDYWKKVRENAIRMLQGELDQPYEFPIITKSGETRWVVEKVTSTTYQGERATLGYFMDISEHKSLEEQFIQAQKMEAVATLAGGIAHDFNNILTAILGNIGLAVLDAKISPRGQSRLAQAEKACLRAQALSQRLLTFAKGGVPVKKLFSVAELLTESTSFTCVGSPVRCETTFPENLWSIEADPGQIGQVFQNLTINAIQAMPTGGTIKVWAENLTLGTDSDLPLGAGRYIKISVQDQGIGIPAGHLPRIFDPYFTTKHMGSGLGLASAYAIIKKHHGHIAVESKQGVGTTFYIYLPAIERQVTPQPEEDRELLVGKGKILVMDDDEMVREVLGRMLVHLGYEPEFARDGHEAIEMFVQAHRFGQAFAAVILDLTVPGAMGGKETMARLLEIDPQVKAIVSSGYSDDPIMADFQEYGFSGVIAKPYKISEIGKILQEVAMGKQ